MLLCLASCNGGSVKDDMTYEVAYVAKEGGVIRGDIEQYCKEGESYDAVTAVALPGYRFIGWDDGVETATRQDIAAAERTSYDALFEPVQLLLYADGELFGEIPLVSINEVDLVDLVPKKEGFVFYRWTIKNAEEFPFLDDTADDFEKLLGIYSGTFLADIPDIKLEAEYEVPSVLCYSDGQLVRFIPFAELALMSDAELEGLVGYATGKEFSGWTFSEESLKSNPAYFGVTDPLPYLRGLAASGELTADEHISLTANYTGNTFTTAADSCITIAHAMGSDYLNSLEAFFDHYERGQRFFEPDISLTSDGKGVLHHIAYIDGDGERPVALAETREEFLARSTEERTYLDLEQLIGLMRSYPDIMIDFDILSAYNGYLGAAEKYDGVEVFLQELQALVGEETELYDRMVIEILPDVKDAMLADCKAIGLKHFLLPSDPYYHNGDIYLDSAVFHEYCAWARDNGIAYMSFSKITAEAVAIAKSYGMRVSVYTFDDPLKMYEWYDMGVDFIFCNTTVM